MTACCQPRLAPLAAATRLVRGCQPKLGVLPAVLGGARQRSRHCQQRHSPASCRWSTWPRVARYQWSVACRSDSALATAQARGQGLGGIRACCHGSMLGGPDRRQARHRNLKSAVQLYISTANVQGLDREEAGPTLLASQGSQSLKAGDRWPKHLIGGITQQKWGITMAGPLKRFGSE